MSQKQFLSVKEIASFLDLKELSVYRLCQKGHLPSYKFGGTVRIAREDFEQYLQNAKQTIPAGPGLD